MRSLLPVLSILLWLVLGYFIKPCWDAQCNGGSKAAAVVDDTKNIVNKAVTNAPTGPLLFNWDKAEALTGEGWEARRQAILDGLKDDENLEITGHYRAGETNTSTYENLGLARAAEVAKLFKPPLTDERIQLRGQLINGEDSDKTSAFRSAEFRNMKNTASIKEVDDRTLIYFPFSSTNKLNSQEVETYLNDVAERILKSGERVRLTGHTDNVSSDASNMRLGQKRADVVKNYLISKGVPASKIIAESKGESTPVASNDTDDGRAKNRRTELQIIK